MELQAFRLLLKGEPNTGASGKIYYVYFRI